MATTKKKSTAKASKKATKKVAAKTKHKASAKAKSSGKAKKVAKPTKKVEKKVVAKKAAPKKGETKPVVSKKSVTEKIVVQKKEAKPVAQKKTASVKPKAQKEVVSTPVAAVPRPVPPPPTQLTMFQIPNQRPIAHKPVKAVTNDTRTRYSDEELKEFEKLILEKLEKARDEYRILKETLNRNNDEGTDATSGGNTKVLEDGAETAEKENLSQLAARQQKYITNLENALVRIKNGTYGICSVTGKLISKERLIAVPHTTQSIEAKLMQTE
jgi:RNA polymerase-binding transcription factor DksA